MKTHSIALLLLGLGLLVGVGCHRHKWRGATAVACDGALIQISLPVDTLCYQPGDSATVKGWVFVSDDEGDALPGMEVMLTLLEPFGSLEFLDGASRGISDETGRVYFRFRSYNQTGTTTIRAAVGDEAVLWPLTVLPAQASTHRGRDGS